MLKSEINMERACRSCLEETTNVLKIHDFVEIDTTYNRSSFTIAEILMECTAIKVNNISLLKFIMSLYAMVRFINCRIQCVQFRIF